MNGINGNTVLLAFASSIAFVSSSEDEKDRQTKSKCEKEGEGMTSKVFLLVVLI